MTNDPLESFSRQIADWTQELLEHGRYPFRKVAVAPQVITPSGPVAPDLVLWINRPSCMAGGVIFFPRKASDKHFPRYAEAAQSLGISHFTVWDSQAVEIRHATEPFGLDTSLTVADTTSPQDFRTTLAELLGRLKILSVTGAVAPHALPSCHLVNLCLMTLEKARPEVLEAMRRHRSDTPLSSPEVRADNRSWHTLFHLLTLCSFDLLPETVHAERLERALEIATEALPEHLRNCCTGIDPAPLPERAAVAFHHLFRRLTQIGWRDDTTRMLSTLEQLLDESGRDTTATVMAAGNTTETEEHLLLLNPLRFDTSQACSLISTPGRLPGLILHRDLKKLPPARVATTSPFKLPQGAPPPFTRIYGHLPAAHFETGLNSEEILMHLRVSWPNRRFRPPRQTPYWILGLLHLLGLCREGASIDIDTPPDWPRSRPGYFLTDLLVEKFTLEELKPADSGLAIQMLKSAPEGSSATIQLSEETRLVEADWFQGKPASALALATYLPSAVWSLIQQGDLSFQPADIVSTLPPSGLRHFLGSSWGKLLLAASGLPTASDTDPVNSAEFVPLPAKALLEQLANDELSSLLTQQQNDQIEQELAQWFAVEPPVTSDETFQGTRQKRLANSEKQRLVSEVFVDGIPQFPAQYLFDHYRPQLKSHSLAGPLYFQRRFFTQVELATRDGKLLVADNDLTAKALLLASHSGLEQIDLPCDETVLADIMTRYQNDLEKLRSHLLERCNLLFEGADKARSLAKKIWRQQGLPPWEALDSDF